MFYRVVRYTSIRVIISIALVFCCNLYQMDVKDTFLNGLNEEEVYINQPRCFEVHGWDTHVCKLKKVMYGMGTMCMVLKDRWVLTKFWMTKNATNLNIYYLCEKSNLIVLVIYVYCIIIIGNLEKLIAWCKNNFESE